MGWGVVVWRGYVVGSGGRHGGTGVERGCGWYRLTLAAIDERLQRVTPLRYLPSKSRGKLFFYWNSEHHSELSPPRNTVKMGCFRYFYLKSICNQHQL